MSFLLFSSISFVFMVQPKQLFDSTPDSIPRPSSLVETSNIIIDNNWSATVAMYDWCSGSGIEGDPYIIQGINISGGAGGAGLTILNSAEYFVIRNSSFSDVAQLYGHYIFAGICIDKAEFGLIENCTITNNYYGISIVNVEHVTIINNTFIGSHDDPLTGMGPAVYIDRAEDVNVTYNYIKDYYMGVMLRRSEYSVIDHNHIENLLFGYTSNAGVYFYHTNDSAITYNDFYGCESSETQVSSALSMAGVTDSIYVDPNCINIYVHGNRFFELSEDPSEDPSDDLIVSNPSIPSYHLSLIIGIVITIVIIKMSRIKRRTK